MNELIHVHLDTGQPLVLARDLHKGLEIQTKYATWMERMAEYGFVEGGLCRYPHNPPYAELVVMLS